MRRLPTIAFALALGWCTSARAQLSQSWVSGVGDDANPCTRTAPCKTFAAALLLTASGGQISALDPGDFQPVTIGKAVTIDGAGGQARIQPAAADGITVAASATDLVTLRGITLVGDGTHRGIVFSSGAALTLDKCTVSGFQHGVDFQPTVAGAQLLVDGLITRDNAGAGLRLGASGAAPAAFAVVARSRAEHNAIGFLAIAGARLSIYDSLAAHNSTNGVLALLDAAGGIASINLEEAVVSDNLVGVRAEAAAGSATIRMSKVLATGNPMSTSSAGGGLILSFGNNRIDLLPSISLSSTAPSQTVTHGETASFPVGVAVNGLLAAPIAFACTGLPANAICEITPSTLPASMSGMLTVTVRTGPPMFGRLAPRRGPAMAITVALLLAFALRRRRFATLLVLCVAFTALVSCDSSATPGDLGATDLSTSADLATPSDDLSGPDLSGPDLAGTVAPGSYPFTLTAVSGGVTASLPLTLTVN